MDGRVFWKVAPLISQSRLRSLDLVEGRQVHSFVPAEESGVQPVMELKRGTWQLFCVWIRTVCGAMVESDVFFMPRSLELVSEVIKSYYGVLSRGYGTKNSCTSQGSVTFCGTAGSDFSTRRAGLGLSQSRV